MKLPDDYDAKTKCILTDKAGNGILNEVFPSEIDAMRPELRCYSLTPLIEYDEMESNILW